MGGKGWFEVVVYEDLRKYLINEDKPNGDSEWGWCAGEQVKALRFYLHPDVKILRVWSVGDYQGEYYAILYTPEKTIVLWRDSFGSCSGCDALEGSNGYEYIKDTLREGNTKQFKSVDEVIEYLKNDVASLDWRDVRNEMIEFFEKYRYAFENGTIGELIDVLGAYDELVSK